MKPLLVLAFVLTAAATAPAQDLIFETSTTRLAIRRDAVVGSLIEKQNGRELLRPGGVPFAAVRKNGVLTPASAVVPRGGLLHVTFGTSGADADFRITALPEYILVELTAFHGDGIQLIRLMQLNASLANAGEPLAVRWDDEFAVSLIGLTPQVDTRVTGNGMVAVVHSDFSMQGRRVVIVASPTPRFLETVRQVERDFQLPSPTLGGTWAKSSADVHTSYLFTDLTEANADETIRYAKLGGFRYILVYNWDWSSSLGSYPINTRNFPRGEQSLKAVIDKCHAAGLKVGMHMLTSFVGKDDPLVTPTPNPGLLKDGVATLAADVSVDAKVLPAQLTAPLSQSGFPVEPDPSYGPASDILVDGEIVHYERVGASGFGLCVRGFAGTKATPHKAGARIYHLAERVGSYLADLKTPLEESISDRVAGIINRCGFDMIYFDGGEVNSANGPAWYWDGPQQIQIWGKANRELLVQGSGMTSWTWHIFARGTSDDYSAVAPKQYLDYHKIADVWKSYHSDFLPAELGWTGFLTDAPDHPATTPDEVEYYAVRMLALDSPVSLETTLDALRANGRTAEMLQLLGRYEQLRLGGTVSAATRKQLAAGEWHMTSTGQFHPIRYEAQRVIVPGPIAAKNDFPAQPLKFRMRVVPSVAPPGDPSNIALLGAGRQIELQPPDGKATLPGSLIRHFVFPKPLDLTQHRALAVEIDVEGLPPASAEHPVLNIQLEAAGQFYRDYYVDLDANGPRTVVLAEPGTGRMLAEFRPAPANYPFKMAMYNFNYGDVVGMNLRWMKYPKEIGLRSSIGSVEALRERDGTLKNITISSRSSSIAIPAEMKTGDYAEYWADGKIHIFDRNGVALSTVAANSGLRLEAAENKLTLNAVGSGTVVFTAITLGD